MIFVLIVVQIAALKVAACAISPRLKINSVHKFNSILVVCWLAGARAIASAHHTTSTSNRVRETFNQHTSHKGDARARARDRV